MRLPGKGVHVVTVNEYLAQRDADWMGAGIYRFLGMTVGVIRNGQTSAEKRAAYAADITYGTNNEFGFDYLRDNLAFRPEDRVQRELVFADRRRGGFDPDRRGAHAADHLRSGRREHRTLHPINKLVPRQERLRRRGRRTGRVISPWTKRAGRSPSARKATRTSRR
jgi:hypothetical protein